MAKEQTPPRTLKVRTTEDVRRIRSQQVRMMASTDTELKAMANLLDITVSELRRDYRKELNNGRNYVYAALSVKLVNNAMSGDVRSMLAWLRQFGGWQEISRREITGKNGEPISFRSLDATSLAAVLEALSQKGTAGRGYGRTGPQIEIGDAEVLDLDAISRPANESAEE